MTFDFPLPFGPTIEEKFYDEKKLQFSSSRF